MGGVQTNRLHRCPTRERCQAFLSLSAGSLKDRFSRLCSPMIMPVRRRPVGRSIKFCHLFQGSTGPNATEGTVFHRDSITPARETARDRTLVRCPGMEDAVDDACTACVRSEFPVVTAIRPREWDMGHDAGFNRHRRLHLLYQLAFADAR